MLKTYFMQFTVYLAIFSAQIQAMDGIGRTAWEKTNSDARIDTECLQWKRAMQRGLKATSENIDDPDFCDDMRRRISHFEKMLKGSNQVDQQTSEQSEQKHQ